MKTRNLAFAATLILVVEATADGQLVYSTNNGAITITGYTGSPVSLAIPETAYGLPVKQIADFAFYFCGSLANVSIPSNVTSIGQAPFGDCQSLTNISVNTNNTHYVSANGALLNSAQSTVIQYACGLHGSYTVPASVTSIGYLAFVGSRLSAILVDGANTHYSSYGGVLYNYPQSTLIQCPAGFVGSYVVPGTVTDIGTSSFSYCTRVTAVFIPASVATIEINAFYDTERLGTISVDSQNTHYSSLNGVLFNKAGTTLVQYPLGIGGVYSVPATVASVAVNAFADSPVLAGVVVPDSVTNIGNGAFYGCGKLASATVGHGLTSVGANAFQNCSSLTNLIFSGNAPFLGGSAFSGVSRGVVYYYYGTSGWGTRYGGLPTVMLEAPPPQIADVQTGPFGFTVKGVTNQAVTIEASTNLVAWAPIWTTTLTGTNATFTDSQWTNYARRFFRAR
jgi:hypothetical protein